MALALGPHVFRTTLTARCVFSLIVWARVVCSQSGSLMPQRPSSVPQRIDAAVEVSLGTFAGDQHIVVVDFRSITIHSGFSARATLC